MINKMEQATQTTPQLPKRQPQKTKKYAQTSRAKVLESENWYLRMGACKQLQPKFTSQARTQILPLTMK
jgi:hypothetical protein